MTTVVGHNMKALREASGCTEEKVAEYLEIGRSTYSQYENGEEDIPVDIMESVADLYGCDLYALYGENLNIERMMLVTIPGFGTLSVQDMKQVAAFKRVIRNYIKMDMMAGTYSAQSSF